MPEYECSTGILRAICLNVLSRNNFRCMEMLQKSKKAPTDLHPTSPSDNSVLHGPRGLCQKARNRRRCNAAALPADDARAAGERPGKKGCVLARPRAEERWGCRGRGLRELFLGSLPNPLSKEPCLQMEPATGRLRSVYSAASPSARARRCLRPFKAK